MAHEAAEEGWNSGLRGFMTFENAKLFLTTDNVNDNFGGRKRLHLVLSEEPFKDLFEIVQFFMSFGFDINEVDMGDDEIGPNERFRSEATLLHREFYGAPDYRCLSFLDKLIGAGARMDLKDCYGDTPLAIACQSFPDTSLCEAYKLETIKAVKILIDNGAKIENVSPDIEVPSEFKRISDNRSACLASIRTVFGIWRYRNVDCSTSFGILDKSIVQMIMKEAWKSRFDWTI